MLGGPTVKQLWELAGQQHSIRAIARELRLSRNTVRKYLRAPGIPRYTPRPPRPSKLDAYRDHLRDRLAAGVENGGRAAPRAARAGLHRQLHHPEELPAAAPAPPDRDGDGPVRDRARRAGPGRLRAVRVSHPDRAAAVVLGLRAGARLVAGSVPGVRPTRRRRDVPPLPPACVRGAGRCAALLSLRSDQGRRPGP